MDAPPKSLHELKERLRTIHPLLSVTHSGNMQDPEFLFTLKENLTASVTWELNLHLLDRSQLVVFDPYSGKPLQHYSHMSLTQWVYAAEDLMAVLKKADEKAEEKEKLRQCLEFYDSVTGS